MEVEQPMALESQLFGIASRAAFGWVAVRHSVLNIQWLQQVHHVRCIVFPRGRQKSWSFIFVEKPVFLIEP